MIHILQAIILGIVQGITEFLPISSTGHLQLLPRLLGESWDWSRNMTFDVALHAGTLLALLAYFWRDWIDIIRFAIPGVRHSDSVEHSYGPSTLWAIIVGTIPAAIFGFLLEKRIGLYEESTDPSISMRLMLVIATSLIVVAVLMWAADKYSRKRKKELVQTGLGDWISIGLAQAVALVPGVSRSGATISAGLARGLDRTAAARYSFLLSMPIVLAAVALKLKDLLKVGLPAADKAPFAAGVISSAIVGYLAIRFLLGYLNKRGMNAFVWYRIALGAVIMGVVLIGRM